MIVKNIIKEILTLKDNNSGKKIPADIVLKNGNILLRSFNIIEFNEEEGWIKGLTMQEEYIHAKENRDPVYGTFKVDEIKEVNCEELELIPA